MVVSYFLDETLKIGIFGFTGCAGDQLVIIHDEDRLLEYFQGSDIIDFVMASSNPDNESELDIAIIEGSVSTEAEIVELIEIRNRSKLLVAIGNCAIHGGIQAGVNGEWESKYKEIYGNLVELTTAIPPKPLHEYVTVDFAVPGCPIDKDQIYNIFARMTHGIAPEMTARPVCEECRQAENVCLLDKMKLCLGPLTTAGCGAACPSSNVECMGCFGLYQNANIVSFIKNLENRGFTKAVVLQRMACFGGLTVRNKLLNLELMEK